MKQEGSLKKIWNHRKQILEGLTNSVFKREYVEKIAKERMDICMSCELIDTIGKDCIVIGTQPCCKHCGCTLSCKTRSLSSSCEHPDKPKWENVLDEEEQDKLYTEIEYNPDHD